MGSTRLPGKVMAPIEGHPMIHHVVARARASRVEDVWVVTTESPADDALVAWCRTSGVPVFRGSERDVLDRYRRAAQAAEADVVVRVTGDCPLLDPGVVDRTLALFEQGGYDYASNCNPPTFPDGLDTEVVARAALDRAWREATLPSQREHVTPYVWGNPRLFRLGNLTSAVDLSAHRWTVDEPEDLAFVRAVYRMAGASLFGMERTLDIVHGAPRIAEANRAFTRNEGYRKSLQEDRAWQESAR
jgi:spore coat polysaccharide biosynthesis protein SpsF (cytidylyltransferase family)